MGKDRGEGVAPSPKPAADARMAERFASKRVIFGNKKNPKVFLTIPCFWPPYSASPGLDAAAENPSLRGDAQVWMRGYAEDGDDERQRHERWLQPIRLVDHDKFSEEMFFCFHNIVFISRCYWSRC